MRSAVYIVYIVVLLGLALPLACGGGGDEGAGPGGSETGNAAPRVVVSTGIIADLAARVAGPDARVEAVIPGSADIHSVQPPTAAARRIAEADLLLVNGYRLEEGLLDLFFQNRSGDVPIVVMADGLQPLDGPTSAIEGEAVATAEGDPHFWLDVAHAMHYVERIRDALAAVDPAHAAAYRERAEAYLDELRTLDDEVRTAILRIPAERRQLVVFHDAFSYFAQAYGLELAAAVLPASPSQQASARLIAEVTELVRERAIPTVYREPQFASTALDLIAEETGARVLVLYSAVFTGEVTSYQALMRANAAAIVDGLGVGLAVRPGVADGQGSAR